ncbi:MAG: neutral zinc metallopeptidase [Chloroflexota bacterium]|nr:neutral zinc metallopeptidase [Chloroflexota bacterium]
MPRLLVLRFVLLVMAVVVPLAPAPVAAQVAEADERSAAAAAREISRLEADGDFAELYDRLHPDVRAEVPEDALVGWYEAQFAGSQPGELSVTDVEFGPWSWPVTGKRYPRAAAVGFTQPYTVGGERSEVEGVLYLVEAGDDWGWFWGTSRASVDEQIALYASDELGPAFADWSAPARLAAFPDILHAHVDAYWAGQFAYADRPYDPPGGVVEINGPVVTACGAADPMAAAAFYCLIDETIYYSGDFRRTVEARVGDFGWVVVVAHEWGHHVQYQLGIDLGGAPNQAGDYSSFELEQQADCLAGAYTEAAGEVDWLAVGDVEEALLITGLAGDPAGTPYDDPFAHGTGEERVEAFRDGYEGGVEACDLPL